VNIQVNSAEDSRPRALARKYGYALRRSRRTLVDSNNRGGYRILDPFRNVIVSGENFDLDASDVEVFFAR